MNKQLRKRHRQAWSILAFLFPPAILFAWLVIPNQLPVKRLEAPAAKPLPVIIHSADRDDFRITIRSNAEQSSWQLEWINKKTLEVPSAVIYRVTNEQQPVEKNELIGRIETRGRYLFPLSDGSGMKKPLQFILYDFIHQQIIDSFNIQP